MKKHLLILLIIIPSLATSQEKGAKEIVVITSGSDEHTNYVQTLNAFISHGFEIDEKDDLFHTVIFEPVKYKFGYGKGKPRHWNYLIVNAEFEGDSIVIFPRNKQSGRLKRETIYDPKYPETVAAYEQIIEVVGDLGKLSFPKLVGYGVKETGHRDDVYGVRRSK